MKYLLVGSISILFASNAYAASTVTFEANEAAECFKNIVTSFSKIAADPKNQELLEASVSQMIAGIMDLITVAKSNGISITVDECRRIFDNLDAHCKTELNKLLQDDKKRNALTPCCNDMTQEEIQENAACCQDQTKSSCCKKCNKCKDKCCCNSTTTSCSSCCKSVPCDDTKNCCDESGCPIEPAHS